jgi:hypothetical protein
MPRNRYSNARGNGVWSFYPNAFFSVTRFDEIMQHLHFSDNKSPMAATDRAWKIRPVVETFQ